MCPIKKGHHSTLIFFEPNRLLHHSAGCFDASARKKRKARSTFCLFFFFFFSSRRFCALEELRARYMSRDDDLDTKRHRSLKGEKKTVEKKKNLFLLLLLPVWYGHNVTVNEKKEKKDAKIFFLYHRSRFFVSFLVVNIFATTFNY